MVDAKKNNIVLILFVFLFFTSCSTSHIGFYSHGWGYTYLRLNKVTKHYKLIDKGMFYINSKGKFEIKEDSIFFYPKDSIITEIAIVKESYDSTLRDSVKVIVYNSWRADLNEKVVFKKEGEWTAMTDRAIFIDYPLLKMGYLDTVRYLYLPDTIPLAYDKTSFFIYYVGNRLMYIPKDTNANVFEIYLDYARLGKYYPKSGVFKKDDIVLEFRRGGENLLTGNKAVTSVTRCSHYYMFRFFSRKLWRKIIGKRIRRWYMIRKRRKMEQKRYDDRQNKHQR